MKPNRPHVVSSSRNYITVGWEHCDSLILRKIEKVEDVASAVTDESTSDEDGEDESRWYVLERKDQILGWCVVYMGFKIQTEVGPMAPGDYYQFRLKTKTKQKESEWSDILFAATRDDFIAAGQLHRTVENGPVTTLRKILSQRPSIVDTPNSYGQTPLRLAILKNNISFMGILLNHGADLGSLGTGSGTTPLMLAAQRGQVEAVQLLVEKGSSWLVKDRNGVTALNYAVDNSHLPIVELALDESVGVDVKDKFGWSLLMRGVILKSSLEVLTHLLNNGSDPNEADDRRQTVLMQAVLSGRPEVVELLLKKGADISVRNIYGHSAYDMAKYSISEGIRKIAHLLGSESEEDLNKNKIGEKRSESWAKCITTTTTVSTRVKNFGFCFPDMGRITYERIEGEEGEKLDELFGIKDCLIEVNPGRVILPPDFQEIGERIIDLKIREDDVWLVSYPRTGSTWAQEMIWCIGNDLDFEKAKQLQQLRTPLLELTAIMAHHHGDWMKELGNSVDLVETLPSPRFVKSHLPWELLPKELETVQPKVVYVARNPKDMCVSYYHYCLLVHNMKGSFEDFCELFLKDKAPVGPIWNHILGFWNRRHQKNILFLKYEEMKKDQISAIRKAAEFMNKSLSEEDIQRLADHLSFSKMKENPAVNLEPLIAKKEGPDFLKNSKLRFIRKGEVGDHKNFMSNELIARFDKWTKENLRGTGLSFD